MAMFTLSGSCRARYPALSPSQSSSDSTGNFTVSRHWEISVMAGYRSSGMRPNSFSTQRMPQKSFFVTGSSARQKGSMKMFASSGKQGSHTLFPPRAAVR